MKNPKGAIFSVAFTFVFCVWLLKADKWVSPAVHDVVHFLLVAWIPPYFIYRFVKWRRSRK